MEYTIPKRTPNCKHKRLFVCSYCIPFGTYPPEYKPWPPPRRYRPDPAYPLIRPSGPSPSPIAAIGEAGGYWENEYRQPFIGRSGRLLNTYLSKHGISRSRLWVSNIYPHWTGDGDPDPTQEQIAYGTAILVDQLRAVRPRYILALGRVAAQFFGNHLPLETSHGLPFLWRSCPWGDDIWVVSCFHPASALRNPENAGKCFYDIKQFSLYARGDLRPIESQDVCPTPTYTLKDRIGPSIAGPYAAVDTEGYRWDPHCISYSAATGRGEVVLAKNITPTRLPWGRDKIILHHSMHDLPVLAAMGIEVADDAFDDTILMARLLLLEPAGLKDLALRHCGMRMREYEDVVGPHWRRAVLDYLRRAVGGDFPKPEPMPVKDKKTGKWKLYQPQPVGNRIAGIVRDADAGKPVKLADRWNKIHPALRASVEKVVGPFPHSHPRYAPLEELTPYAATDADATRRIHAKLWPQIVALKLRRAYYTDLHAIPMFARMSTYGMRIDLGHFARLRPKVVADRDNAGRKWLKRYSPKKWLNLASGDQMAWFFFDHLGLTAPKMTDSGARPSVDDGVMELIKDQHPSIPAYIAWKKTHTAVTFVDRIPKWAQDVGGLSLLFTQINTQGTVTGRPSTKDPNLLNIPVRTDLGKQIRNGFIARPNRRLLSIDLAQIELRICAHLSQDKEMISAFRAGRDIHDNTAQRQGISRYIAKTVNFGILYGMSHYRLRSTLLEAGVEVSEDDAARIIRDWFRLYSGVREWFKGLFADARRRGFVRGLSGRLRYLPNLYLREGDPLRSEAERHAGNFPIQEGNAYLTKRAMRRMWRWIRENPGEQVEPLLQIYDEVLLEIPEGREELGPIFRSLMTADRGMFRVPIKADMAIGERWGEL